MKNNIAYQTEHLARYFTANRIAWEQFYDSERAIIGNLALGRDQRILDIGCGCGGLGLALRDRFGAERYTGVEINALAVEAGRMMNSAAKIYCGDILELSRGVLHGSFYDVVFSLSCVDWNVQFSDMLATAWDHVAQGGSLVATFRLTTGEGCDDMEKSYQYINCDGNLEGERAAYVVLNAGSLIDTLRQFDPESIRAVGYWGPPSATAVTPFEKLCFSAFSIRKRANGNDAAPTMALDLPAEILDSIGAGPTA
jgi:SAM-dependent methyltransferase